MDLIKTLLIYMALMVGSATEAAPILTPLPAQTALPAATPYVTSAALSTSTALPTLAPTATPSPYTTLYVGDRGEDVKRLQRRLTELGYLTDKIDGIYGQNTKRAVERFQYYNNLKADGVAGKITQAVLYENPNVVPAAPDVTALPTNPPLNGITVPVYYVDQDGRLLSRVDMICYSSTTVYANDQNAGANYVLTSAAAVNVSVAGGVAVPASVTFRYQRQSSPAPAVQAQVPVYYMTDTGSMLFQTTLRLDPGITVQVDADVRAVPETYVLTSAGSVEVAVSAAGKADPASVVFIFHNAAPTPEPAPQQASFTVQYVNENGFLLAETKLTASFGSSVSIAADPEMAGQGYRLMSQSPVTVSISDEGAVTPAVVIFTYSYQAPSPEPTQEATPAPTAEPTAEPTIEPTAEPTEEPTAEPTEEPTPEPTEEPTPEPSEEPTPEPTEEPTPEPTEEPTPEPTEEPTPEPTEEPTPAPTAVPVQEMNSPVLLNESTASMGWFKNRQGQVLISLRALADNAGWTYYTSGTSILRGREVNVAYTADGVRTLTVDGQSFIGGAFVWQGDLLVGADFLTALGADVTETGSGLLISFPQA